MESTIEKLVDNLEKEKGLNLDEKGEMDRVLRAAAKGIENDRIADFVKSMRKKIDAPVSKIFTKEGINFESLESAAKTEAKVVIKIQTEYAEKRKQENQKSNNVDENDKIKSEENAKQIEKENIIAENESYLDDYMPNLEPATRKIIVKGMYDAKTYVDEFKTRVDNGEDKKAVRDDMSKKRNESKADVAFREMHMAINLNKEIKNKEKLEHKQPTKTESETHEQFTQDDEIKSAEHIADIVDAFSEETQELLERTDDGEITESASQEFISATAAKAIKELKEEIEKFKKDIEDASKENDYPDKLIDLFEKLEESQKKLRASMRIEEIVREQIGDIGYVNEKRTERSEYLKTAVQRYFGENNRESIIMIFEDMLEKEKAKGINLEEIIGFDDILECVLIEMNRYPGQSGNVDTIRKREEIFFKKHIEEKALKIVKEKVNRDRTKAAAAGNDKLKEFYNGISIKHSERIRDISLKELNHMEKNIIPIKKNVNREQEQKKRNDETLRNVEAVDTEKMKEIKDRYEFLSYATKLYFSSGINVSEIYGMFRENCVSMKIGFKDIREAVVQETIDAYTSANYANIRSCENEMRRQSDLIAKLKEANKKAEQNGNLDLIDKNNQKIAKCQEKIEKERRVTTNIKRAIILNKSHKESETQVKKTDISAETQQEKSPEPKKKKGLFSFLRRAIPKKEIEPKDVNGETTTLNDLQKEELQEDKEQPKPVNENKTNNQLEVSTISVEGDELATETANKPENETKNPDVGDDGR